MKKELKAYYEATDNLAKFFANKYFTDKNCEPEEWWVADDIGGVYHVNDYYFDINYMATALEYNATFDQVADYYDLALEAYENKKTIANFKNYLKHGFTYV